MEDDAYITKQKVVCKNCGCVDHNANSCPEPTTSYGMVNISLVADYGEIQLLKKHFCAERDTSCKIVSTKYPDVCGFLPNDLNPVAKNVTYKADTNSVDVKDSLSCRISDYYRSNIRFMMVSRRFSLGFVDFIRGKYEFNKVESICRLFVQMYTKEIDLIKNNDYDDLLVMFVNKHNEPREEILNRMREGRYAAEYSAARIKFEILKGKNFDSEKIPQNLDFYIEHVKPLWGSTPEWGFPKGRRDNKTEENISCACREFEEETGLKTNDYAILNRIEPIEESLTGTNNQCYKHIYYVSTTRSEIIYDQRKFDDHEIGEVGWFTFDEAISKIRPYHESKKNVIINIYTFLVKHFQENFFYNHS
jgi:8-oxo-dGTP pyrophosphatase MutT (NUDIX family)